MKTILGVTLVLLSLGASAQSRLGHPTGEAFQQLAELDGAQAWALVGDVAVSGDTLVIGAGAANPPSGCFECGVAYVYTAVNGDWTNLQLTATLIPLGEGRQGGFAEGVAISGSTIAVSGYDVNTGSAAVWVYINPSGTVTENAKLTTSQGGSSGEFGPVAIDGGTIVAGSSQASVGTEKEFGIACVYVEPAGGWANMTQNATLVATSESLDDQFGAFVGVSGNTVVVGAPAAKENGIVQGLAYLFVQPAEGWNGTQGQTTELFASNGMPGTDFGSVSISGGTVAVGAEGQTVGSNRDQGAVYIFLQPPAGWPKTMTETAEITATNGKAGSFFGRSVVISGKTLLVGAPNVRTQQGVAYVFSEPSGGWQSGAGGAAIAASDGAPYNVFSEAIAFGGGVVAVSAPGWPSGGLGDGAVYVFGPTQ